MNNHKQANFLYSEVNSKEHLLMMMSQLIQSLYPFSINLLHYFIFELLRVNNGSTMASRVSLDVAKGTLWALSALLKSQTNKEYSWQEIHPC